MFAAPEPSLFPDDAARLRVVRRPTADPPADRSSAYGAAPTSGYGVREVAGYGAHKIDGYGAGQVTGYGRKADPMKIGQDQSTPSTPPQ